MQNVEYKAELRDLPLARMVTTEVGAKLAETIQQVDTYYRLASGRLKRREIWMLEAGAGSVPEGTPPDEVEWIFYDRPNTVSAKVSRFTIYTPEEAAERFGRQPLPVWVVVTKRREVWIGGPGEAEGVRIHLDTVEGLGTFLEFEAPVTEDRDMAASRRAVEWLREAFRMTTGEAIDCGYSDLLARGE